MSNFDKWVNGYFEGQDSLRTFKIGDHNASPDTQNVLETENYMMARNKEVYNKQFDEWMQGVDWTELDKMVQEMVDKSGVKDKMVNNIWPGRVVNDQDDQNSMGEFEMNGNYIGINNYVIESAAADSDVDVDILRTQVLFHEVVHAAGKHENQVSYKSFKSMFDVFKEVFLKEFVVLSKPTTETMISGGNYFTNKRKIHRDKLGRKTGEEDYNFFEFLDDAIAEKMSVDMLHDYAKRTGKFDTQALQKFDTNYLQNPNVNSGVVYLQFMDMLLDVLSAFNNMDKQVVWQGFVRGAFNEKPFEDAGVKEMFAKAFYPNFLQDLSVVEGEEDLVELLKKTIERIKQNNK